MCSHFPFVVGGFLGGILIGKSKFLKTNHVLTYAVALKLISDGLFTTLTPDKFTTAMGFGFLAMFGMGLMLVALIVCVQLSCDDEHIGLATLVLGSVRSIGGSVAVTIYTSIMMNTVKEDAGPRTGAAVLPAGLPPSSLPPLLKLLLGGRPHDALKVPGVDQKILDAATIAVKWSWTLAFQ
jgi:Fungal trichothecene efflux pump (TRI12)